MTTTDWRKLCSRMADELDHYRQLLADDRREVHRVALEARAVLARWGRHPAPVPEDAANPWKDALIDALVCNFLLNKENESDPKKALHDLVSWELELAGDPSINPLMRPVPVSERLPGPGDCDGKGRCWLHLPDMGTEPLWRLTDPSLRSRYHSHWLPATALPVPGQGEI